MKNFKIFMILLMVVSFPVYLFPAFEVQMIGGKTAGIGNTLIVDNDGYEAGFQNPAMLSYIKTLVGIAAYSPMLIGLGESSINSFSGGVAYKYKNMGALGIYYNGLNVNSFDENIYGESIFKVLYGRKIVKSFSAGISLSLLKWSSAFSMFDNSIKEEAESSLIVNLGAGIVFDGVKNMKIGFVVENLNSPSISSGDKLPLDLKLGLVYGNTGGKDWNLYFNMDTKSNTLNYSLGSELNRILNLFSVRSGLEFIDSGSGINFTFGAGYKYITLDYDVVVDYGFIYPILNLTDTLGTHVISVGIRY